jgi:hypothetical protein
MSVAVLAGCPGTPTTPTPSGSASAKPSTPASTPASGTPSAPASGATGTPSVAPTGLPSTPDTSSRATIQGVVFDDLGSRLDGVTVTGKVLGSGTFANGSDTLSVSTQIGSYSLNGAPTGATIMITATKQGMTTRQQTIVPLSNLQGDTTLNRVSFGETVGTTADRVYPLSDKPEITSFTPAKDATGVDAATTFTLTFNEPVNTADVESNFAIYVGGPRSDIGAGVDMTNPLTGAQGRYTLSATNTPLYYTFDPNKDDGAAANTRGKVRFSGAPIYDSASFTAAWSNNNQTVTFTFRPGAKLPTDKDASKLPQYAVSFKDGSIRDAAGTGRDDSWFRVSPAQVGRVGYKFTVAADTTSPSLTSITPVNKDALATSATTDAIRAQFSETMALFPGNNGGNSIPANTDAGYAATNTNFRYFVSPNGVTTLPDGTSILSGGFDFGLTSGPSTGITPRSAKFYDGDATRSTIEMVPLQGDLAGGTGIAGLTVNGVASTTTNLNLSAVTNLEVGDLLMYNGSPAVNNTGRVSVINTGTNSATIGNPAFGAAPGVNGQAVAYWAAASGSGALPAGTTTMTGMTAGQIDGLRAGDNVTIQMGAGAPQRVRVTATPAAGATTFTFTPALTAASAATPAITFVSAKQGVGSGYGTGNNVWVAASNNIIDPAANTINTSNNINIRSGISQ